MLQLPETALSNNRRRKSAGNNTNVPRATEDRLAKQRLDDLETPIADARLMASILAVLTGKFAQEACAYRGLPPSITASKMAGDIADDVEQILFAAYHLEEMLRDLNEKYMADLP